MGPIIITFGASGPSDSIPWANKRGDHQEEAKAAIDHQSTVLIGLMPAYPAEPVPSAP